MLETLMRALIIGFAIAAAIGPIGILCIRRSIQVGFWGGFTCGLGAAVADGVYASVAAFGLVVAEDLSENTGVIGRAIGGIILIFLAISIYRSKTDMKLTSVQIKDHAKGFASIFLLTLSNPATIIAFLAVFAGFGVTIGSAVNDKLVLIGGIFLGSALWWLVLAGGACRLRHRLDAKKIRYINIVSSLGIGGAGGFALLSSLFM